MFTIFVMYSSLTLDMPNTTSCFGNSSKDFSKAIDSITPVSWLEIWLEVDIN